MAASETTSDRHCWTWLHVKEKERWLTGNPKKASRRFRFCVLQSHYLQFVYESFWFVNIIEEFVGSCTNNWISPFIFQCLTLFCCIYVCIVHTNISLLYITFHPSGEPFEMPAKCSWFLALKEDLSMKKTLRHLSWKCLQSFSRFVK